MPRYGEYESVREVYRGGLAVVYTARPASGGEDKLALKVLELPVYLADDERVEQESVLFLESAEAQRRVAASSAAWAPVHASGRCEGGAWYATDLFDRSAEKLVLHRRELESAELYRVVEAVVQGLIALRQIGQRPHGNLKPTNVLMSGRGEVASARIVLCDPLASSRVKPEEDAVKDLKDIGDLLHQMVLHRPMRSAMAWPVSLTPEWQRLGRVGAGWLELCNALLNPTAAPPSLDEVAGFLPDLIGAPGGSSALVGGATPQAASVPRTTPVPPAGPAPGPHSSAGVDFSKSRPASGVGAASPVVLEPGAGTAMATPVPGSSAPASGSAVTPITPGSHPGSGAPSRPSLGKWKDEPAPLPEKGMPRRSKLGLYAGIGVAGVAVVVGAAVFFMRGDKPEGGGVVKGGGAPKQEPVEAAFTDPDPRDVRFKQIIEETSESAAKIRDLLKETAPDVDLKNLNDAIASFDADSRSVLALAWNATTKESIVSGIDRLRQAARSVQDLTQSFGARSPDPRVAARQKADTVIGAARSIREALHADAGVVGQIDQVISSIQAQYEAANPKAPPWKPGQDNPIAVTYAKALDDSVGAAQARVGQIFAAIPDPRTGKEREGFEAAIAEARETTQALAAINKPSPDLDRDVGALVEAVAKLDPAKTPWTLENIATVRDSVALVGTSAETTLKKARDAWAKNASDPRPAARASAEQTIPSLDSASQQAVAALAAIPKVSGLSESQRTELLSSIQSAVNLLGESGAALRRTIDGSSLPEWGVRAATEAQKQVEQIAAADGAAKKAREELVALMKKNEQVMAAAADQHRKGLIAECGAIVASLNAGTMPSDGAEGGSLAERYRRVESDTEFASVKADAAVSEAGARLTRLASIAKGTDAAVLIGELRDAAGKGLVAESWLALSRLASPEMKGVPGSVQDLGAIAGAAAQLREAVGRVPDSARAGELSKQVVAAGRALWLSSVARLDFAKGADVKTARDVMPALGLSDADMQALGGRERFNFMVMDLRDALAGADEARAREAVARFNAGVGGLDEATRAQASVTGALAALDQAINVSEPAAPPPPDFSKLGPGLRGWTAEEGKSHGVDTVTYRKGGDALVFARATEDTMVSVTEVSLGVFIDAVSDASRWAEVSRLLPSRTARPEGPRTWVWSVDDSKIEIATPAPGGYSQGWLAEWPDRIRAAYPPAMVDVIAPPDRSTPMQNVSAAAAVYVAAILGCRLPDSSEWKAALQVETGASGEPKANRRDSTWEEVKQFCLEQSQLPQNRAISPNWPDGGIFVPRGFSPGLLGPKAVPAVAGADGVLWFQAVDQGGGTVFHHLVGNVAEFVYEKPGDIEGMDPTYDTVVGKLGSNSDKATLVIGASALSPPDVQPTVPEESRFSKSNPAVAAKSDVGFRLAFTSKSGPPRPKPLPDRVRDAAGALAFLPPK